jgi:succinyl-CoA synthetase beta subunit
MTDLLKKLENADLITIGIDGRVKIGIGDDCASIIQSLHLDQMCIKAQIHASGRREGYFNNNLEYGRVKLAKTKRETINVVKHMLTNTLEPSKLVPRAR